MLPPVKASILQTEPLCFDVLALFEHVIEWIVHLLLLFPPIATCIVELLNEEPVLFICLHSSPSASRSGHLTVNGKKAHSTISLLGFHRGACLFRANQNGAAARGE